MLLELLVFVIVVNFNVVNVKYDYVRVCLDNVDCIVEVVGLDMWGYWEVDVVFLLWLSKVGIVEVLMEVGCSEDVLWGMVKGLKLEIVVEVEILFEGKGWLLVMFWVYEVIEQQCNYEILKGVG